MIGVLDEELPKDLQMREKLTMEKAIECARHAENVKLNLAQQATSSLSVDRVLSVHRQSYMPSTHNKTSKFESEPSAAKQTQQKCTRCGYAHRSPRQDACPAAGATCH